MLVVCKQCGEKCEKPVNYINRAKKSGANLYCDRECAGLSRRKNLSKQLKVANKRLYDEQYRAKNRATLKEKKRAHFLKTYDPVKAAEERKKNMARHVEYCRDPEYKKYKKKYDRAYRAKRYFGDFWESFCVLLDLEHEIETRATKYEIYQTNGTLNKHQQRRRYYENLISNQS